MKIMFVVCAAFMIWSIMGLWVAFLLQHFNGTNALYDDIMESSMIGVFIFALLSACFYERIEKNN